MSLAANCWRAPPADIGKHGSPLHVSQPARIEQLPGGRREQDVQRDDIGAGAERIQRPVCYPVALGQHRIGLRVVARQAAAEAGRQPRHDAADNAAADDTHRLAVQVEADQRVELGIGAAHLGISLVQVAVQGHIRASIRAIIGAGAYSAMA